MIYLILLLNLLFQLIVFILENPISFCFFFMNPHLVVFGFNVISYPRILIKVSLAFSLIFCFAFPLFPFLVLLLFYFLIYVNVKN